VRNEEEKEEEGGGGGAGGGYLEALNMETLGIMELGGASGGKSLAKSNTYNRPSYPKCTYCRGEGD